jgi:two-component system response regulator QseB
MKILLVEDDASLGESVRAALAKAHHIVDWVDSIAMATVRVAMDTFELLVLDLGLPDAEGFGAVVAMRKVAPKVPIIVISANDEISDRIRALDAGADDYLVKPFDLEELLARVRAAMRRPAAIAESKLLVRGLEVDLAGCTVSLNGEEVPLRRREYQILVALLMRRGRVTSRQQLEEAVSTYDQSVESNAVEVVIHHLRKKLGEGIIETVRGLGYIIRVDVAPKLES